MLQSETKIAQTKIASRLSSLVVEHLSCKQKVAGSNPVWALEFVFNTITNNKSLVKNQANL